MSRSSSVGGMVELNSLSGLEVGHGQGVIVSLFDPPGEVFLLPRL